MADSTYESPASLRPTKFGSGDFVKDRPAINAGMRDLHLQAGKALRLLEQTNHPPELFCQGSSIVRMVGDDSGFPVLQVLDESRMRQTLAERLAWNKRDQHGKHPARPPWDLPKNILAIPHNQLPFPIVKRVTRRPVFTDGGLIRTPGYDSETGIYYRPSKRFRLPPVSDRPSPKELGRAKRLIQIELLDDFPFTGDPDRAHAICALLQPLVRDLIEGPTPSFLIEKPTPGTGATLLVLVTCYLACGREPAAMAAPSDEAEWRRTLFAKLLQTPEVVLIDNVSSLNIHRLKGGGLRFD